MGGVALIVNRMSRRQRLDNPIEVPPLSFLASDTLGKFRPRTERLSKDAWPATSILLTTRSQYHDPLGTLFIVLMGSHVARIARKLESGPYCFGF